MNNRLAHFQDPKHAALIDCLEGRTEANRREASKAMADARKRRMKAARIKLDQQSKKIVRTIYETARRVKGCTSIPFEVDHLTPISKGGKHRPSNLQVIPAIMNMRKNTLTQSEFLQSIEDERKIQKTMENYLLP